MVYNLNPNFFSKNSMSNINLVKEHYSFYNLINVYLVINCPKKNFIE